MQPLWGYRTIGWMGQMVWMWIVQQIVSVKDICVIRYADTLHVVESLNWQEQTLTSEGWFGMECCRCMC